MSSVRCVTHVSGPDPNEFGGREGIRTPDPLLAKQVLSQLSYTPTRNSSILVDFSLLRILVASYWETLSTKICKALVLITRSSTLPFAVADTPWRC